MHPKWIKEKAIAMYLEGMSISAISRVLDISLVTVYSWIKKVLWALKVYKIRWLNQKQIRCKEISFDEMWTYKGCGKGADRNSKWIWTCIADGKFLFEVGSRGEDTFIEFYKKIPRGDCYYTDNYKVYDWLLLIFT